MKTLERITISKLIETPIKWLQRLDMHPETQSPKTVFWFYFQAVNGFLLMTLLLMNMSLCDIQLEEIGEGIMMLTLISECTIKLLYLHHFRHRLQRLLRLSREIQEVDVGSHQRRLDLFMPVMNVYRGFIQFVCVAHFVVAVATNSVTARIWLPDKRLVSDNFLVMFAINVWEAMGLLYTVGYFQIQFDSLIIALIWSAGVYFRMLRGYFEEIGRKEDGGMIGIRREIVWGIDQQKVLYEFIEGIEELSNIGALLVLGAAVSGTCFAIYIFVNSEGDIKFPLFAAATILQLFCFCFASHFVETESELLSISIYQSNWEDFGEQEKYMLKFAMLRSQKKARLTAGKFFDLSLVTFAAVIRLTASIYMLLINTN